MNAIKAENLTYVYSPNTPFEKAAIQDINLEIEQGEFVGVIGHTGSGKSTLIQHFTDNLLGALVDQLMVVSLQTDTDFFSVSHFGFSSSYF